MVRTTGFYCMLPDPYSGSGYETTRVLGYRYIRIIGKYIIPYTNILCTKCYHNGTKYNTSASPSQPRYTYVWDVRLLKTTD